jgi:hypothetical protein
MSLLIKAMCKGTGSVGCGVELVIIVVIDEVEEVSSLEAG